MLGSAIKNLVIIKLDEYTPYGPAQGSLPASGLSSVKPVYEYTDQMLAEAANEMLMLVPLHKLVYKTMSVSGTPDAGDSKVGMIVLPNDFLRLHTLRMAGWVQPVHVAVHEGDPVYVKQFNRWNRGNKRKPVVTIEGSGLDGSTAVARKLHYYSVDASTTTHTVDEFKYIPVFDLNADYDRSVAELIALQCARKVMEVHGNVEQVNVMTNEINSVLENLRQ